MDPVADSAHSHGSAGAAAGAGLRRQHVAHPKKFIASTTHHHASAIASAEARQRESRGHYHNYHNHSHTQSECTNGICHLTGAPAHNNSNVPAHHKENGAGGVIFTSPSYSETPLPALF